ncbi:MAG TPA: rRNA maturation RNase YbeY [Pirellulales bacterium]|nr:rRNA maturation RNase YbeY [Pirellulales bacterium]
MPRRVLHIAITNDQDRLAIDADRLRAAVEGVLLAEGIRAGEISLAIVDDPTIHDLNRQWLNHDEPTDVLSFVLEESDGYREGEIIVSADTASSRAAEFGWTAEAELLLYVVHGALHLVGYDDKEPAKREVMRERERYHISRLGLSQGGEAGERASAGDI